MAPLFILATLLVSAGRAIITNLASGLGGTVPKYGAWGTGAGTAATGDTTLFSEAAEARVAGTVSRSSSFTSLDTMVVTSTVTSASAQTITNAGLFDASVGGNLFVKTNFTGIVLATGEKITFNWRFIVA